MKQSVCDCGQAFEARCTAVTEPENLEKPYCLRKLLVTKEIDKIHKASKRAFETRAVFVQTKTELNTSSLCRGFCTSVLFILVCTYHMKLPYMAVLLY